MNRRPSDRPVPKPCRDAVKYSYGRALSAASRHTHAAHDGSSSLLVFGSARSGSTLLHELLSRLPGHAAIFEPLNPMHDPHLSSFWSEEWLRLTREDSFPELEGFLQQVLRGHHLTRWSTAHSTPWQILRARRFVVKFIRACRAVGWFVARFPNNQKILIVRHPAAVVSSMLRSPGPWRYWPPPFVLDPVRTQVEADLDIRMRVPDTRAGLLAVFCCADMRLALRETTVAELHTVVYEELVAEPANVVRKLSADLGLDVPAHFDLHARASRTANADSAVRTGRDPLAGWRRNLDKKSKMEVLSVMEAFGLDFYGDNLQIDRPKFDAFRRFDSR